VIPAKNEDAEKKRRLRFYRSRLISC